MATKTGLTKAAPCGAGRKPTHRFSAKGDSDFAASIQKQLCLGFGDEKQYLHVRKSLADRARPISISRRGINRKKPASRKRTISGKTSLFVYRTRSSSRKTHAPKKHSRPSNLGDLERKFQTGPQTANHQPIPGKSWDWYQCPFAEESSRKTKTTLHTTDEKPVSTRSTSSRRLFITPDDKPSSKDGMSSDEFDDLDGELLHKSFNPLSFEERIPDDESSTDSSDDPGDSYIPLCTYDGYLQKWYYTPIPTPCLELGRNFMVTVFAGKEQEDLEKCIRSMLKESFLWYLEEKSSVSQGYGVYLKKAIGTILPSDSVETSLHSHIAVARVRTQEKVNEAATSVIKHIAENLCGVMLMCEYRRLDVSTFRQIEEIILRDDETTRKGRRKMLVILVFSWMDKYSFKYGCSGGSKYLKKILSEERLCTKGTKEAISKTFGQPHCFLMPDSSYYENEWESCIEELNNFIRGHSGDISVEASELKHSLNACEAIIYKANLGQQI